MTHVSVDQLTRMLLGVFSAVAALGDSPMVAEAAGAARDARVVTELKDLHGRVVGRVELKGTTNGTLVHLEMLDGPLGVHAFHIHETGKCDPPSFASAGGHFNPTKRQHGFENPLGPHAGDLPNLHVPASGNLDVEFLAASVQLTGGPNGALNGDGAALVIHAVGDDYRSDPAGDAGDRIACGVITPPKPWPLRYLEGLTK